jgi:hypothetical protein
MDVEDARSRLVEALVLITTVLPMLKVTKVRYSLVEQANQLVYKALRLEFTDAKLHSSLVNLLRLQFVTDEKMYT